VALSQQGRLGEAVASFRRALALAPGYAEAHYNLGTALLVLGRREEAVASFRAALALRPDYAAALSNLGTALDDLGRPAEAAVRLKQAARLRPDFAEAHTNLGLALVELGRLSEAEAAYEAALTVNPRHADAHANPAAACQAQGRLDEALAHFEQAMWLAPDNPAIRWNRALALLQSGSFEEGWREYEWRWNRGTPLRYSPAALWDGSPLAGRTILLHAEQGLGDTLQFVRYAPLVQRHGATVILECPHPLTPLLSTGTGIARVVPAGEPPPPFDVYAPLLSLPRLLGTTLAEVPADVPYLRADPVLVEHWAERLAVLPGLKVGIVWQGNPRHPWDRQRSVPLAAFAPLAQVPGVTLVSLQRDPGVEQLQAAPFPVVHLGDGVDAQAGSFADTAAVMTSVDLVVTVDTAAAHLAGALAVPVWVALPVRCDWRWLWGRDDSPWYPTLRLFRQATWGDWAPVFGQLAAALRERAAVRTRGVRVEISPGELLDMLTILEIQAERIADPAKQAQVQAELAAVRATAAGAVAETPAVRALRAQLRAVTEALWAVEDALRLCERDGAFGPRFVELARSVYRHNDRRAALKRRVNELLGAPFGEQKAYAGGN
jgi:Flp pilus assembly protein TadD